MGEHDAENPRKLFAMNLNFLFELEEEVARYYLLGVSDIN